MTPKQFKTLIISIIVVLLVVIIIIFAGKNKNTNNSNNISKKEYDIEFRQYSDAETGEILYLVYDKKSKRVIEEGLDESSLKAYKDNPDFKGKIAED